MLLFGDEVIDDVITPFGFNVFSGVSEHLSRWWCRRRSSSASCIFDWWIRL